MLRHSLAPLLLILLAGLVSACSIFDFDTNDKPILSREERDSLRIMSDRLREEGQQLRERSVFTEALEYQQRALLFSTQLNDTLRMTQDLNQLGTTFRRLGRLEQALNKHYQALDLSENYHDRMSDDAVKNLVISCNGIGNVYLSLGELDMAQSFFLRSLEGEITLGSKLGMAINYANIGSIHEQRAELDSAMTFYEKSMLLNCEIDNTIGKSLCHVYFGNIYTKRDSLDLAQQEYLAAVQIMKEHEDRWHAFEPLLALSHNLVRQGKLDEAEIYADKVIRIASEVRAFEHLRSANILLAELCEQRGDMRGALDYYRQSKIWADSIHNPEDDIRLRNACIDYELQSSQRQVDALQKAYAANDRMHTIVLYSGVTMMILLLIVIGVLLYASNSRKQRIEALDKLNSMRTTFFRNLTHEFRTPLTVIIGLADQMKSDNDLKEEQRQHMLNSISKQGHTLLDLVSELLGISKMMAGNEHCEWRHGNIVAFLRMVSANYSDYAAMRNIQLRFTSEQEVIDMDFVPEYYQRIINNLLGNSFKFTPSGGSITVRLDKKSDHMILEVSDTGDGISVEDLPHIFELFYQGHHSKQGCTGIGLPYVQQMVRQMGGIITAENNLPRGAMMRIIIGLKCNDEQITEIMPWTLEDSYHNLSRQKLPIAIEYEANEDSTLPLVMVVEDNPEISDYIALLLNSRYRVIKANDAYEALRLVGNHLPDLIITDLMMPGMDGYELCHSIRRSAVLSDVPIIIVSARSEDKDRVRGYEDGADAYLLKPFNPAELYAVISRLLNQRRQQRDHVRTLIANTPVTEPSSAGSHYTVEKTNDENESRIFLTRLNNIIRDQMVQGDLSIDTIANLMFTSRSTLARRIKEISGSSPSAYILQLRLDNACSLLRESQLSIGEIALSCGFDDMSYFSRVFRQNFDITPSQYRNEEKLEE